MTRTRVLTLSVLIALCVAVSVVLVVEYKKFSNRGVVSVPPPIPEVPREEVQATPTPATHLGGIIKEVSGGSFTLVPISINDGEQDSSLRERTVTVTESTVITRAVVENSEDANREMEAFQVKMGEYVDAVGTFHRENGVDAKLPGNLVPPTPPIPNHRLETVTVEALRTGQTVGVLVGTDVRNEKSFTAQAIEILEVPEVTEAVETSPAAERTF